MVINKKILLVFVMAACVFLVQQSSAYSNESVNAETSLNTAKACISEMISLSIPISRVNETYNEASQLYEAQLNLEKQKRKYDYKLVVQYSTDICNIKEIAIKAQDELEIFKSKFQESSEQTDLSSIQQEYDEIISSFEEERFEETLDLIKTGYQTLSETEASQTTVNLFYSTTTRTIKSFLIENWLKIVITLAIVIVVLTIFWRTLKKIRIKMQLYNLAMREKSIEDLIRKMQYSYFKNKTMSETEFSVKIERYKDMIRDIKRQVPSLKEKLIKISEKKAEFKNSKNYTTNVKEQVKKRRINVKKKI